jgi:hypothetical protein
MSNETIGGSETVSAASVANEAADSCADTLDFETTLDKH